MKKLLALALLFAIPSSIVWAQDELGPDQHWVEQVGGSVAFPASGDASKAYNVGFGGDFSISYRITPNISEGVMTGYYQFNIQNAPSGSNSNFSYVPLMEVTRCVIGDGDFRPYAFFGLGAAFNTLKLSPTSTTETDLLMSPGAGVLWAAFPKAALYVQGRLDVDFISDNISSAHSTNPSVFLPLEGGLIFYVL